MSKWPQPQLCSRCLLWKSNISVLFIWIERWVEFLGNRKVFPFIFQRIFPCHSVAYWVIWDVMVLQKNTEKVLFLFRRNLWTTSSCRMISALNVEHSLTLRSRRVSVRKNSRLMNQQLKKMNLKTIECSELILLLTFSIVISLL